MTFRSCALAALLAAAGFAAQATEFRSSDIHPDDYPTVLAVRHMSETLARSSGGKLSIKVFAKSALGNEKDTIEQTKLVADKVREHQRADRRFAHGDASALETPRRGADRATPVIWLQDGRRATIKHTATGSGHGSTPVVRTGATRCGTEPQSISLARDSDATLHRSP